MIEADWKQQLDYISSLGSYSHQILTHSIDAFFSSAKSSFSASGSPIETTTVLEWNEKFIRVFLFIYLTVFVKNAVP